MVTLSEMMEKSLFSHLSTLVKLLDHHIFKDRSRYGIYDFQTVPNTVSMYTVLVSIIISHLIKHQYNGGVIIINVSGRFPMDMILHHENFNNDWIENGKLKSYTIDSMTKLILLIDSFNNNNDIKDETLIIFNNIHDLIDLYKFELLSSYQEVMLRNYIGNVSTIKEQLEREKFENTEPQLIEIPDSSDLIKENPTTKFNNHLIYLMNQLTKLSFSKNLPVFLTGKVDSKFQFFTPKLFAEPLSNNFSNFSNISSQPSSDTYLTSEPRITQRPSSSGSVSGSNGNLSANSSSSSIVQDKSKSKLSKGKLVLTYSNRGRINKNNNISTQEKRIGQQMESIISSRVIFYNDWSDKVPPLHESDNKERMVHVAKIDDKLIYFESKDGGLVDLCKEDSGNYGNNSANQNSFIESTQIPSDSVDETVDSDAQEEGPTGANTLVLNTNRINLPSSPNLTTSQFEIIPPSTSEVNAQMVLTLPCQKRNNNNSNNHNNYTNNLKKDLIPDVIEDSQPIESQLFL